MRRYAMPEGARLAIVERLLPERAVVIRPHRDRPAYDDVWRP
jgi:hypothetical protein